jgi:uncharacterized protein YbbC (DUF1343 family)
MAFRLIISFLLVLFNFWYVYIPVNYENNPNEFKLGNEVLFDTKLDELKNKNIALVTNQTGILSDGTHILDALLAKGVNVVKIFTPEHGIRGDENYSDKDPKTGVPIISIYGANVKPSPEDLSDVDIMVYDIQDVGARFYTYTSTLYYVIESAVENNKKLIVCDRPVIINPNYVDGFMLESSFESFVGKIPTPICYGMTCGELAEYLKDDINPVSNSVEVVKMKNYSRSTDYNNLNLTWVKPSPNMFTSSTAVVYPAVCFLEGANVSEGRGTEKPFEYFGAPWCDGKQLAAELNSYNLEGVTFESASFTPSEKISSYSPKFFKKECRGVYIKITDKNKFQAVKAGVAILVSLKKLFPQFKFNDNNYIDKLAGTDKLRIKIINGDNYNSIINSWKDDLEQFKNLRSQYLLYN